VTGPARRSIWAPRLETANFTNKTNFRGAPRNTRQDIFASDALHVVERFTLVDADTIRYQFTVEDPRVWTRAWSGEIPIRRFEGPLFEYACHEGNYGLPNILRAARAQETQETSGR
jgi:hypothetical protein